MIRLSFIVPFYKVEPYLEQCIRSLYEQDIPSDEYEVICVDDCSPDGCRAIVERLQHSFPTLRLVCHSKNKRQGSARNTGLKASQGKYVWFVDSDDYIVPNVLNLLLKEIEHYDLEVLEFDRNVVSLKGKVLYKTPDYVDNDIYSGIDYVTNQKYEAWHSRCSVAWRCLYRRSFLIQNELFFAENVMYEDTDWSLELFSLAKSVKHINAVCYNYRFNEQSVSHVPNSPLKMVYQVLLMNRVQQLYVNITDQTYKDLICSYVHNEISNLGVQITDMPFMQRVRYAFMIQKENIRILRPVTSFRNWLRIRYAISI